jgi:hypothetical protein
MTGDGAKKENKNSVVIMENENIETIQNFPC